MVREFNKRAQFFGLYLAFITVFLISISLGLYYIQQGNIGSSLVSPKAILDIEDDLKEFERLEEIYILESLEESSFGTGEFKGGAFFRERFLEGVYENSFMKGFIFSSLTIKGRNIENEVPGLLENILYPDEPSIDSDGRLVFERAKIGKSLILIADNSSKINFRIDFKFNFSKKYIASFIDENYKLEEA